MTDFWICNEGCKTSATNGERYTLCDMRGKRKRGACLEGAGKLLSRAYPRNTSEQMRLQPFHFIDSRNARPDNIGHVIGIGEYRRGGGIGQIGTARMVGHGLGPHRQSYGAIKGDDAGAFAALVLDQPLFDPRHVARAVGRGLE